MKFPKTDMIEKNKTLTIKTSLEKKIVYIGDNPP